MHLRCSNRAVALRLWALVLLALMPVLAKAQDMNAQQDLATDSQTPQAAVAPAAVPMFSGVVEADPVGADDHTRALDCLSMAIAYEAAGQPVAGQQAVGQVVLNRVRDPRFPKTVCGVVFQGSSRSTGCQFTFACDGSFRRRMSEATLLTARTIAQDVLDGVAPDRVGGATHYHADYVQPYWASYGRQVTKIGAHIFYRMPGDQLQLTRIGALTQNEPGEDALPAMQRFAANRHTFARQGHRAPAPARMAQSASAAPHAMFAPWGLPVRAGNSN